MINLFYKLKHEDKERFVFFDRFEKLCKDNKTTPTAVIIKLGYTKGNVTYWKNGATPNGEILLKLAQHFNVSTDYLLEITDDPTPPDEKSRPIDTERDKLINDLLKRLEAEDDINVLKDVSDYSDYVIERRSRNKK